MHAFYVAVFKDIPGGSVFKTDEDYFANYALSSIIIEPQLSNGTDREKVRLAFEAGNIESRPLRKPMHLQPIFAKYPYCGYIVAETLFEKGLCLPSGSNLTDDDRSRIKKVIFGLFPKK